MKKLLVFVAALAVAAPLMAQSFQEMSQEYWATYEAFLVTKVKAFPKGAYVRVSFKNGKMLDGRFGRYERFSDALWIMPTEPRTGLGRFFGDTAYSMRQVLDIVIQEPI